jgi:hypothetical protein
MTDRVVDLVATGAECRVHTGTKKPITRLGGEVRHLCAVAAALPPLAGLRAGWSASAIVYVVYEPGPCSFVLQRHLAALGHHCEVVPAPGDLLPAARACRYAFAAVHETGSPVRTSASDAIGCPASTEFLAPANAGPMAM